MQNANEQKDKLLQKSFNILIIYLAAILFLTSEITAPALYHNSPFDSYVY